MVMIHKECSINKNLMSLKSSIVDALIISESELIEKENNN